MLEFTEDPQDTLEHFLIHGPFDGSGPSSTLKGTYRYAAWCEAEDSRYSDPDRSFPRFDSVNQCALRCREPHFLGHLFIPVVPFTDENVGGMIGSSQLNWPNYLID